eukprot:11603423-Ditylum_brightwellii.AAC.1
MKQIAYELGFLDTNNLNLYSKDRPKDDNGKILDESFSLKSIVASFTDFVEEETPLQVMTQSAGKMIGLDVMVDHSPKGHPKVAGEGIEHTWVNSKLYLRTVPVLQRKTAQQ